MKRPPEHCRAAGALRTTPGTSSPPPLAQLLPRELGDYRAAQPGGCTHLRGPSLPQFRGMREAWQPGCSSIPPCAKAAPIRCPNPKTTVTKTYQIEPGEEPPPASPPSPNGIEQICSRTSPARSQAASDIHAPWHGSAARPLPPAWHRPGDAPSIPAQQNPSCPLQIPPRPPWRDSSSLVQLAPRVLVHQVRSPR